MKRTRWYFVVEESFPEFQVRQGELLYGKRVSRRRVPIRSNTHWFPWIRVSRVSIRSFPVTLISPSQLRTIIFLKQALIAIFNPVQRTGVTFFCCP